MSKEFPQDVLEAASRALASGFRKARHMAEPTDPIEIIANAIVVAKAEEREACLKVIDGELLRNRDGEICVLDENASPLRMIAAIRKRGEP